jgi:hypothetical protein
LPLFYNHFSQKHLLIGTAVHVRSKKPGFFAWGMPLAPFKHPFASPTLLAEGQKNQVSGLLAERLSFGTGLAFAAFARIKGLRTRIG